MTYAIDYLWIMFVSLTSLLGHCTQYNKKYYYKVGSGESAREFWFKTPPALGPGPYTFGLIGQFPSFSTVIELGSLKLERMRGS